MRLALSIGLLVPAVLSAQDGRTPGYALASVPGHADHAELHRPGPVEPGAELAAMRTVGLERDPVALRRAAELAMTVGLLTDAERDSARLAWFREAETYARRARALEPGDLEAAFLEAAAVGLQSDHLPIRARVDAVRRVLESGLAILERDPEHAGGNHLVGRVTASGMRLNPVLRFVAARIIGGDLLRQASWERAEGFLRTAVEAEPGNPMHRIELAQVYEHTARVDEARAQLRRVLAHPDPTPLVAYYQGRARAILERLP